MAIEALVALMIPILIILIGGTLAAIGLFSGHQKRKLIHAERLAALEKGVELPPLPKEFTGSVNGKPARSYLLKGLIWLAVGLGIAVFFIAITLSTGSHGDGPPFGVAFLGLIPALIGVAYLVFYKIEGKNLRND